VLTKCLARVRWSRYVIPVVYLCQAQYASTAQWILLCLLACFSNMYVSSKGWHSQVFNSVGGKDYIYIYIYMVHIYIYAPCRANKCRIVHREDASMLYTRQWYVSIGSPYIECPTIYIFLSWKLYYIYAYIYVTYVCLCVYIYVCLHTRTYVYIYWRIVCIWKNNYIIL